MSTIWPRPGSTPSAARWRAWVGAGLLCLVLGVAAPPVSEASEASKGGDVAGLVKKTSGSVHVERDGQRLPAVIGMPVQAADRLVTGADGVVGITLKDDTLLAAGPGSSLLIERFAFNPTTHEGGMLLQLTRGTVRAVTGLIARLSPQSVQVRTPTSTAGIRGTEFIVEVPDHD